MLDPRAACTRSPWQHARGLLELERADVGVVVVFGVAIGLLSLATPVAVQALVDTVAFGSLLQPVVVLTVLLAIGLVCSAAVRLLQVAAVEVVLQRVFVRTFADAGRRLVDVDARERGSIREMFLRVFEVPALQKALATLLVDGTGLVLQTLVGLVVLALYHPLLLAFAGVLLVGLGAVVLGLGVGAVGSALGESRAKYAVAGWLDQLARTPSAFRSAGARARALERVDALALEWLHARKRHFLRLLAQHVGGATLAVLGSTALLGLGGVLVLREQLTLGQLVAAELVMGALALSFFKLGKQLEAAYDVIAAVTKLGALSDLPTERRGGERFVARGPLGVRVQVQRCGLAESPVLRDVELEARPREHVGLVGPGSSGKSLVLDLLLGLHTPSLGRVLVDGLDLRELDLPSVRETIVLVRGAELVHDTVLANLRLLRPSATIAEVQAVVAQVGLDDVVRALPRGLGTMVAPEGAPLSSSACRRLVLARALLARPALLLLDGALDGLALDEHAHAALVQRVFAADAPWTAIAISEDPRVTAAASRVWRLGGGAAAEVTR